MSRSPKTNSKKSLASSEKKTFIIAEIAQAHDGSLGIAHSYIDALAETGVDAVKFQTHIAEAESSEYEPFRVNFSYVDPTRFDYWKRIEFTPDQWAGLKRHCEEKGLEFLSSPFSVAAVDLLEKINISKYKIGSGEVNNFLLLEKIAKTRKPILLSSGMSSLIELDETVEFLRPFKNELSVLHCTTAYPTKPGQWALNFIQELKKRYGLPVGFSDHSGKTHPPLAAYALGAEIIEVHAVFDKRMFGPDSKASLTISEIKYLVESIRELETDRNSDLYKTEKAELLAVKQIFEKSLAVNKAMKAGETITFDCLEAKKPKGFGINAKEFKTIIGRQLIRDLMAFEFLKEEDIQ